MVENSLPKEIKEILEALKEKERGILIKRFGLKSGKRMTLAAIGQELKLTRERIRQIQNSALNKIKKSELQNNKLFVAIQSLANNQGGIISIKDTAQKLQIENNFALFLLEATKNLKNIKSSKSLRAAFINLNLRSADIIQAEKELILILASKNKAIETQKLIELFNQKFQIKLESQTVKNIISSSGSFAFDWKGRVGLASSREVNPKSARDKAYYILKKEERPLHFTHIAELISKEKFLGKNPTPATVHNELILDKRFALVGRGIYALSEWGFKGGTVEEVIAEVLRENPKGLKRDAIIKEVLKTKFVARNTVMMNLLVKEQFEKDKKGLYKLKTQKSNKN